MLVIGGVNSNGAVSSAELYDPTNGTWSTVAPLTTARYIHTASLLPSGRVLVTGGINGPFLASTEIYDPATGTWSPGAPLATGRYWQNATLLPGGNLLITAGYGSSGRLTSAELYDEGLGYPPAARPVIASATPALGIGGILSLTGSGFLGSSSASSGTTADSSTNYPLVQLRSLASERSVYLPPGTSWTDASFASAAIYGFPAGHAFATVFVNGIPSASAILQVDSSAGSRLVSVAREAGGTRVRWREVIPGAVYRVQTSDALSGVLAKRRRARCRRMPTA